MYIHVDIQYGKQNHQAARSTFTVCDRGKGRQKKTFDDVGFW